jgi:hypothetical protein
MRMHRGQGWGAGEEKVKQLGHCLWYGSCAMLAGPTPQLASSAIRAWLRSLLRMRVQSCASTCTAPPLLHLPRFPVMHCCCCCVCRASRLAVAFPAGGHPPCTAGPGGAGHGA